MTATTGFEVGKKYINTNLPNRIYECISVFGKNGWLIIKNSPSTHEFDNNRWKEYIPPPPEEWRIVYKTENGELIIGIMPFKSDEEARTSEFWRDSTSSFKTIRVDA